MSSTRLPGKMMLPLYGKHVIERDIERVSRADSVSNTIVATSACTADDILERYARRSGATVYRGSESDVLARMYEAATNISADVVVRITGDCPLISPRCIDVVVDRLRETSADYASNTLERTLPRGLDVEAFTYETFSMVEDRATASDEREHVTLDYRRSPDRFDLVNVTDEETFDTAHLHGRHDLRLTLDEADDYELLRRVYEGLAPDGHLNIKDAVSHIDREGIATLNQDVQQKHPTTTEE